MESAIDVRSKGQQFIKRKFIRWTYFSGITTFSGTHFFVPPQGDTASRPQSCPSGSLRFNTDSAKLEYYRGDTIGWSDIEAELTELGGGTGSNAGLGHRGFAFGRS